jgi:hypothetical protein
MAIMHQGMWHTIYQMEVRPQRSMTWISNVDACHYLTDKRQIAQLDPLIAAHATSYLHTGMMNNVNIIQLIGKW